MTDHSEHPEPPDSPLPETPVNPIRRPRGQPSPGGRAVAPDPDLVAERISRLTTDALVTRRGYLRILGVLSGGLAVGNVAVALGAFQRRTEGADVEMVIAEDIDAIPVGGEVRFGYPTDNDPAMLIRLEEDLFVAYSAVCTHLACEVLWVPDDNDLYCPCHNGHFDPANGAPTAGPPQRPLPEIRLAQRGNSIVALGEGRIHAEGG
ncbi:MAG: Rieske (2Fe-2S) protein [Acidimicrobiia bacterium]|nr:Rieske (2Fe-2S) protein [Acidimicrobiia bacterium]